MAALIADGNDDVSEVEVAVVDAAAADDDDDELIGFKVVLAPPPPAALFPPLSPEFELL